MYDIFFISDSKVNVSSWNNFKSRFPHAQKIENCESYETLNKKTLTKNFWVVWDCLHIDQDFDFTYRLTEWDNQYIHVFKNGEHYDGVCLFPKNLNVSSKEWKYRFFTNKKEIDILASRPKPYDIIKLDSYEGLVTAQEIAHSEFILCIPDDVVPTDIPQYQVPAWDKDVVHVFKNDKTYDGIFICHKNNKIAKREFDYRFFTNKKEVNVVASNPKKWEVFNLETFDDYKQAQEKATGPVDAKEVLMPGSMPITDATRDRMRNKAALLPPVTPEITTEKLDPSRLNVPIFILFSKALINSIPSIFSKGLIGRDLNFFKLSNLKEITDKCL